VRDGSGRWLIIHGQPRTLTREASTEYHGSMRRLSSVPVLMHACERGPFLDHDSMLRGLVARGTQVDNQKRKSRREKALTSAANPRN
jgi:hypothetical protein